MSLLKMIKTMKQHAIDLADVIEGFITLFGFANE